MASVIGLLLLPLLIIPISIPACHIYVIKVSIGMVLSSIKWLPPTSLTSKFLAFGTDSAGEKYVRV